MTINNENQKGTNDENKKNNDVIKELNQNFERLKKDVEEKIEDLATKKEIKVIENKEKEIINILDKKADKENVFNSLKLKSDKNISGIYPFPPIDFGKYGRSLST